MQGLVVFNASTRAIVGSVQDMAATYTQIAALTYDATNSQFICFTQQTGANFIIYKMTQTATLTNINQSSTSGTIKMLSATSFVFGLFVFTYSTASSGSLTRKAIYNSTMDTLVASNFNSGVALPNFCFQGNGNGSGGLISAAWLEQNTIDGKAVYSVNPSTGKATGLFSYRSLPATTGGSLVRSGARYDIQVYAEQTTYAGADYQLRIRRFDAGVLYGTAKVVTATTVDIDTQKLGAIPDATLMPVRSRSVALANDFSYAIGG